MDDWHYTFPPVSKEEWLKRIEADLKGRSPEELKTEWWPGHLVDPFHHSEDHTPPVALPDDYFAHPPSLMEWFRFSDGDIEKTNKRILTALQNGAQSIVLDPLGTQLPDFRQLLDNVHTTMIDVHLNIRDPEMMAQIPDATTDFPLNLRLNRDDRNSGDFTPILQNPSAANVQVRVVYAIPSDKDWIHIARQIFEQIQADVNHYDSQTGSGSAYIRNTILNVEAGPGFYQHLLRTRVVQLCWLNVIAKLMGEEMKLASAVECHIRSTNVEDPDRYLIKASSAFLSSALAGAPTICIHPLEEQSLPEFYRRINSNIHHILNYESQIYRGTDPLKGSFFMDFYSRKWAGDILAELI